MVLPQVLAIGSTLVWGKMIKVSYIKIGIALKNKYIFPSVSETAKYIKEKTGCKSSLNGMRSHIADCCNGKRKSAYGHSYQYA